MPHKFAIEIDKKILPATETSQLNLQYDPETEKTVTEALAGGKVVWIALYDPELVKGFFALTAPATAPATEPVTQG